MEIKWKFYVNDCMHNLIVLLTKIVSSVRILSSAF